VNDLWIWIDLRGLRRQSNEDEDTLSTCAPWGLKQGKKKGRSLSAFPRPAPVLNFIKILPTDIHPAEPPTLHSLGSS
jgi:hypothetical protein